MSVLNKLNKKRVLVIDDQESMRAQLRASMTGAGCERLLVVHSIKAALDALAAESFDIVLCDYYLGDNTDGQQFLEYIRTRDLISRNCLFIMITAEQAYQKVVLVAECAPDDYLLKPFTAVQLNARLDRLLDRQAQLAAVSKATDSKDWNAVVAECDRMIEAKSRYLFDAFKIKGAALSKAGRDREAIDHFNAVLIARPLAWAKFGLARAHEQLGDRAAAQALLQEVVAEFPQYLQAYDLLAKILAETDQQQGALEVLQQARQISPGTMSRLRTMSSLAVSVGQNDLAESVMSQALEANKYSPVRDVHDYALLSKALLNQDKTEAALSVVKIARKDFKDGVSDVVLAATESVAHFRAGNEQMAEAALSKAMSADLNTMSAEVAMSVAAACFAFGRDDEASRLIKQAIQNNPDDADLHRKVQSVLADAGDPEVQASALIDSSRREIILLNNDGVRKAEAGQLEEAIQLLSTAADRLPNNLQIVGNAALAMAQHLVKHGLDAERLKGCLRYRHALAEKAPDHPKLAQIDGLLQRLRK